MLSRNENNASQTEDISWDPQNRDALVVDPTKSSLFNLPPEIVANIPSTVSSENEYTSINEVAKVSATLSGTCKSMCVLFKPQLELAKAFHHAVRAETADIAMVVEMVKANPQLLKLIQQNKVVTRGGIVVAGVTLYQFFIGQGDPWAAEQIQPYFADLPNGENERKSQYKPYKPAIERLAMQFKNKEPAYNVMPLIELIIASPPTDIEETLQKNMDYKSKLNEELKKFRNAVNPKPKTVGMMHYEHYTTLLQILDLLFYKYQSLGINHIHYPNCNLAWRQLFGYLQLSLPQVDFFGFLRAFVDEERTPEYKYLEGSFSSDRSADRDCDHPKGLGYDEAVFGAARPCGAICLGPGWAWFWKTHVEKKFQLFYELILQQPKSQASRVIC